MFGVIAIVLGHGVVKPAPASSAAGDAVGNRPLPVGLTMAERLHVNGESYELLAEPRKLLCDALREDLHLTGTHIGCEHGVCGACTVLVDGRAMRSCLLFAVQMARHEITTVEAVAKNGRLSPLQQALHEEHGLQCGFCTPGIVMTFEAWLRDNPAPSEVAVREALSGNLCRCTGYHNIVRAILKAAGATSGTERPT